MRRVLQRGAVALVVGLLLVRCSTGTEPFVVFVDVSVDSAIVYLGDSLHVDFVAVAANGDTVPDAQVQLVSSDSSVAVMGTDGWVHGIGSGFATIRASDGSANDSVAITVTPQVTFASISAGYAYTCGVTTVGDGYCWGNNGTVGSGFGGQLGAGDTLSYVFPRKVAGGFHFAQIEAGEVHTCALTAAGDAYCWGRGNEGQLGINSTASSLVPVPVAGGLHFVSIDLGAFHTCGLTATHVAYCWGWNHLGEVGDSTAQMRSVPTPVAGGLAFASLTAGDAHSCGLTVDSLAYCWGWNNHGQTGDSTTVSPRLAPVPVHTTQKFVSIAASSHAYSCAIDSGNTAYCWGHNDDYQLGRSPSSFTDLPVLPVFGGVTMTHLALGGLVSCGLSSAGAPYCWGASYVVGYPGAQGGYSDTPLPIAGGKVFTSISLEHDHVCGMATDGRAYCWGYNSSGQLGIGRPTGTEAIPLPVIGQP